MNGLVAAARTRARTRGPLRRVAVEGDEIDAFGLRFPTILEFEAFLCLVAHADRRDDGARREEVGS